MACQIRVAIKGLSDERRAVYDESSLCPPSLSVPTFCDPVFATEETEDADGNKLPVKSGHLMSDADGNFPVGSLNLGDKRTRIGDEQPGFLAWYRNPSRASADSLAIAYKDGKDNWRRMCPDFIFFSGSDDDVRCRSSILTASTWAMPFRSSGPSRLCCQLR